MALNTSFRFLKGLQGDRKMCDNTWREGGCATSIIKAKYVEERQIQASAMTTALLAQTCSNLCISFEIEAL